MFFCFGVLRCIHRDRLLICTWSQEHLLLLLPIKGYAEGPVEIRGGSAVCTRKVQLLYAGSPPNRTRRVFGFYRFSQVFVERNLPKEADPVRGRSTSCEARLADKALGLFRVHGRSAFVRGRSVCFDGAIKQWRKFGRRTRKVRMAAN